MLLAGISTILAVVSIAADQPAETARDHGTTRLAMVDTMGAVAVSTDLGISWTTIMRCPGGDGSPLRHDGLLPGTVTSFPVTAPAIWEDGFSSDVVAPASAPAPLAHITWFEGALYLACTDGPLYRWQPTGAGSNAPVRVVMAEQSFGAAPMAVSALGSGQRLWIVDRHGKLWSHGSQPGLVRIGVVPEAVLAIAELDGCVVIAGLSAIWKYEDSWSPLLSFRARGLAATGSRLWLAGAHGLLIVDQDRVRTLSIAPLTGVAVAGGLVWMADGQRLHPRAAPAHANDSSGTAQTSSPTGTSPAHDRLDTGRPGERAAGRVPAEQRSHWQIAARALERRMRWMRWFPRLTAEVSGSYQSRSANSESRPVTDHVSHISSRATIVLWLKLSWNIDTSSHDLQTLQRSLL